MNPMMLIDAAILCLVAFVAVRVGTLYVQSTGTVWERFLATAKNSATILKEYVVIIGGASLTFSEKAADMLNFPEVVSSMQRIPTKYVGWAFVATAIIGIGARMRSLLSK